MDDLLLFTPSRESHMPKLEDLLKTLLKNGLKISPMKLLTIKNRIAVHGQHNIHKKESLH